MKSSKEKTKPSSTTEKENIAVKVKHKTVEEYLSGLPTKTRSILNTLRKAIKQVAPEAKEVISYNIPAFRLNGMLIWYAAWKEHVSLYPKSVSMQAAIKELSAYEGGKGTIKFPLNEPLPIDLISKIVTFRIKENLKKTPSK